MHNSAEVIFILIYNYSLITLNYDVIAHYLHLNIMKVSVLH
jgi:hypothetical protein